MTLHKQNGGTTGLVKPSAVSHFGFAGYVTTCLTTKVTGRHTTAWWFHKLVRKPNVRKDVGRPRPT